MRALAVIAHPSASSFSHAMAAAAQEALTQKRCEVSLLDLYAERFKPVDESDAVVARHCDELRRAELILVFHPNWWGQPPAILKGWLDQVFRPGVAYQFPPGVGPDGVPVGLLRAKCGLVFNTSETPWERELAVFGNPLERIWRDCVFGFCGVQEFERRVFGPMSSSTAGMRAEWLNEVRAMAAGRCR